MPARRVWLVMGEMHHRNFVYALWGLLVLSLAFCTHANAGDSNTAMYPATIAVLREVYTSEIIASKFYTAASARAEREQYASIARLFRALRESEAVHARNFKAILDALGAAYASSTAAEITVADTKANLKWALKVELAEIDTTYPTLIGRIRREGHARALQDITYAWQAEMQHRDLIKKMDSGLRFFWGALVEKLRGAHAYHVCQRCGATVFRLPEKACVICGSPVAHYTCVR